MLDRLSSLHKSIQPQKKYEMRSHIKELKKNQRQVNDDDSTLIRKKRFALNQMLHKMRNGKKLHEFPYTKNVAKFERFAGTFF